MRRPVEAGIYLLITGPAAMGAVLPVEAWYVAAVLMIPCGLGLQDAVADAMTVEAVPVVMPRACRLTRQYRARCIPCCRRWAGSR